MSLNEGPRDPLEAFWPDISRRLLAVGANRYRKPVTGKLLDELSSYAGASRDNLLMGNGADEVLYYVFTSLRRDADDFVVTLEPTYPDYRRYARAVGLNTRGVDLSQDFLFDPSDVARAARHPSCRAVLVCNPNNPTGNLFPTETIEEIIRDTACLVVIDEAYYEFSGVTFRDTALSNPRVVLLRTFSKGFSAAGLRFGYLVGHPDTVAAIHRVRTFFNLSLVIQAVALELLRHRDEIGRWNQELKLERERVRHAMCNLDSVEPHPSETNFILFRTAGDHRAVQLRLAERGFSVRDVSLHPLLANCLRVTIGGAEENNGFLAALQAGISQTTEGTAL
jgi:histidinol-phosphate aminotransferase